MRVSLRLRIICRGQKLSLLIFKAKSYGILEKKLKIIDILKKVKYLSFVEKKLRVLPKYLLNGLNLYFFLISK